MSSNDLIICARSVWGTLMSDDTITQAGRTSRLLAVDLPLDIHVGCYYPDRQPYLAFTGETSNVNWTSLRRIVNGFAIYIEQDSKSNDKSCSVIVKLEDLENYEIFELMASELIMLVADYSSQDGLFESIDSILYKWIQFFSSYRNGLTKPQQMGLYAELTFLITTIEALGPNRALEGWAGPLKGCKDFVYSTSAVEVKAISHSEEPIKISSLDQLDTGGINMLFLKVYTIESNNDSELTLPSLVKTVRAIITQQDSSQSERFNVLLANAGYFDIHAPHYSENFFRVSAEYQYVVDEGFPRLTPSTVPKAIYSVRYSLEPSLIVNQQTTSESVINSIGEE